MEGSGFSLKYGSKLEIRCNKVNERKRSEYIKLLDCLRYKNATINSMNDDNRYLYERNPEISLIVLYADVNVEIVKVGKGQSTNIHKVIEQLCVSNHYYERGKKEAVLLLLHDNILIKEEIQEK